MKDLFLLYNTVRFYYACCLFPFHNNKQRDLLTNSRIARHIHLTPIIGGSATISVTDTSRLLPWRRYNDRVNPVDPFHSAV